MSCFGIHISNSPLIMIFIFLIIVVVVGRSDHYSRPRQGSCCLSPQPTTTTTTTTVNSCHATGTSCMAPSRSRKVARDMAISNSSAVKGVSWAVICLDSLKSVSRPPSLETPASFGFDGDVSIVIGVSATAVVGAVVPVVDVGPERDAI